MGHWNGGDRYASPPPPSHMRMHILECSNPVLVTLVMASVTSYLDCPKTLTWLPYVVEKGTFPRKCEETDGFVVSRGAEQDTHFWTCVLSPLESVKGYNV